MFGTSSKISVTDRLREEIKRARANNDPDMRKMMADLTTALKLKGVMVRRKLVAARAECPRCKQLTLQGRLAGTKQHLRVWCETGGCTFSRMME